VASLARILIAVALLASLGVLVAKRPPDWLRAHVDAARARDDPWAAYLAPESACPGRDRTDLGVVSQDRVMVCLLTYARAKAGLQALPVVYRLNRSAVLKAIDITTCEDFSHTACGKPFPSVFQAAGYTGQTGENIAWGASSAGSPLTVVAGWLNSPHHRENLFDRGWSEQGVAMVPAAGFLGSPAAEIWVNEFGTPSA
jgi:uncharacterized protein YkwD